MSPVAISILGGVCVYYFVAWILVGKDPQAGPLVTRYEPPKDISPATLRYMWKQEFDERTFWAGVLGLVSKGLATLKSEKGVAVLQAARIKGPPPALPDEERVLFDGLVKGHLRTGTHVTMLDGHVIVALEKMAATLRKAVAGKWFHENRQYVTAGTLLSAMAIVAVAAPRYKDDWVLLVFSFVLMAPGAFYLYFLTLRLRDLYRTACKQLDAVVIRRAIALVGLFLSCVASVFLGSVEIGFNFGWIALAVTGFLTILNLACLRWMRAPTQEGRRLLDEIDGFRLFLQSVEKYPMDRSEVPNNRAGLYEKYLPYAIALEVEQAWSDRFIALSGTYHEDAGIPGAESFYLGMWNGKPIELVYRPEPPKRY